MLGSATHVVGVLKIGPTSRIPQTISGTLMENGVLVNDDYLRFGFPVMESR